MISDVVRKIWSQELNLTDFSNDDDFFSLGGHSLIMARIQEAIQTETGVEVAMDELFRHPSVSAISGYLTEQTAAAAR